MGKAIGDSLPMAIGIALSPVPIVAVVVMLTLRRGRAGRQLAESGRVRLPERDGDAGATGSQPGPFGSKSRSGGGLAFAATSASMPDFCSSFGWDRSGRHSRVLDQAGSFQG